DVLRASNIGAPVTLADSRSAASMAYFYAARRLAGETVPIAIPEEKRNIFGKIFGRRAA
ncbi:septum site-determining protein MinD, partial [Rhizobium ruizarguesonis]